MSDALRATFFFLSLMATSMAHEQKAALTDILYNERTGNLEIAHRISLHDAEHALQEVRDSKEDLTKSSKAQKAFAEYVAGRFALTSKDKTELKLTLVGQEIERGYLWVYQETKIPKPSFFITNTFLQDVIKDQVNTVNIRYRSEVATFTFKAKSGRQLFDGPTIKEKFSKDLRDFFKYSPKREPLISAHRGGPRLGFPENCIPTFENTLRHTPAILEVDPRYTKDGEIILMHDATLDRTTNGSGKAADYTLSELKKLRLKDVKGNLTEFQIPTLDEALQWAKGKTVLVIDQKDVPIKIRVKKITENKAESHAIVIAYSLADIKESYRLNEKVVMEVMMGDENALEKFEASGVPWQNVVAFIGHDLPPDERLIEKIHKKGAMCIQGSSKNIDQLFLEEKIDMMRLKKGYQKLISSGVNIIETDLGIEAGAALGK